MIETPCNGICQLHPMTGLCRGCGRTGAEIGAWASLSREKRLSIMSGLRERMVAAGMKPFGTGKTGNA